MKWSTARNDDKDRWLLSHRAEPEGASHASVNNSTTYDKVVTTHPGFFITLAVLTRGSRLPKTTPSHGKRPQTFESQTLVQILPLPLASCVILTKWPSLGVNLFICKMCKMKTIPAVEIRLDRQGGAVIKRRAVNQTFCVLILALPLMISRMWAKLVGLLGPHFLKCKMELTSTTTSETTWRIK